MNQADIQKLLGGYATGTLTPEEQQVLFEAALNDQELFDALAREQALRDLLRDPGAKAQLLAALDERPLRWYERLAHHWRPASAILAMAGVSAIAVATFRRANPPQPVIVAQMSAPPASAPPFADSLRPGEPASTPSPASSTAPGPPQAVHAPERRMDGPVRNELKDAEAKTVASADNARLPEELAKLRQETDELKQKSDKDLARGAGEAQPKPAVRAFSPGFRETTTPPKTGSVSGFLAGTQPAPPAVAPASPVPPPVPPQEAAASKPRDSAGAPGGVGGVVGALTQPQFQAAGGQQGQQSAQSQQPSAQQAPQQSTLNQQYVQVTAAPAVVDGIALQDARTLFYENFLPTQSETVTIAQLDSKAGTRKKAERQAEQQAAPQTEKENARQDVLTAANAAAPAQKAVQALDRTANPGIRYTLLRETGKDRFSLVDARSLKSGDHVKLQVEPNDDGNVEIRERRQDGDWRNVLSTGVKKHQPYLTRVLRPDTTEVQVTFVRPAMPINGAFLAGRAAPAPGATKQQSTAEPATYVVGDPRSQRVTFSIKVNYR